jgi:hypothetical protein
MRNSKKLRISSTWCIAPLLMAFASTALAGEPIEAQQSSTGELAIPFAEGSREGDRVEVIASTFDHDTEDYVRAWSCDGTLSRVAPDRATVRLGRGCGKPDMGLRLFVRLSPRNQDRIAMSNLPVTVMSVPPPPSPIKVQLSSKYLSLGQGHKDFVHANLAGRGRIYKRMLGVGGVGLLLDGSKGRTVYSGLGLGYEGLHFAGAGEALVSNLGMGGRLHLFAGMERLAATGSLLVLQEAGTEAALSLRARVRPDSALWLGLDGSVGDLKSLQSVYMGGVGMRFVGRSLLLDMSFGVASRAGGDVGPAASLAIALEV